MSRLNVLKALKALGLDKLEGLHANAWRFILTLEDPSSTVYNPYGATIIRRLLHSLYAGSKKEYNQLASLFLGQIESMLIATTDYNDSRLDTLRLLFTGDVFGSLIMSNILTFQETVESLLYGREERDITPIEDASVTFVSSQNYAIIIHTAITRYLNATPDMEQRIRKREYLSKKSSDMKYPQQKRLISHALYEYLNITINDKSYDSGEQFAILFKNLTKIFEFDDKLIEQCLATRNAAVHDGKCKCSKQVLAIYLLLLFYSVPAKHDPESPLYSEKDEKQIQTEVHKDVIKCRISLAIQSVIGGVVVCAILYLASIVVVGSYVGSSDLERTLMPLNDSQFNARINELYAKKDTATILQVQKDIKWIERELYDQEP